MAGDIKSFCLSNINNLLVNQNNSGSALLQTGSMNKLMLPLNKMENKTLRKLGRISVATSNPEHNVDYSSILSDELGY